MELFRLYPLMDTEDDMGGNESDSYQEVDDDATEVQGEEETEVEQPEQKTVPLAEFLRIKKELKEHRKRVKEIENERKTTDHQTKIEKIGQLVREKGYDDDLADVLKTMAGELFSSISVKSGEDEDLMEDLRDAAMENPEVLKSKDEIIGLVKKYRTVDKDFGVEQALALIKPPKVKVHELRTQIEQENLYSRGKAESRRVDNASPSKPKNPYPLDDADRKALAKLREMQPDSGWTPEKYYKMMKG